MFDVLRSPSLLTPPTPHAFASFKGRPLSATSKYRLNGGQYYCCGRVSTKASRQVVLGLGFAFAVARYRHF
jgi:hypothetical protein